MRAKRKATKQRQAGFTAQKYEVCDKVRMGEGSITPSLLKEMRAENYNFSASQDALYAEGKEFITPTSERPSERKARPVWTGVMMYFPLVWAEVAKVSVLGNKQHVPGQPLHWERGLSADQMDAALRHMLDHGRGELHDVDGALHLAKAVWRLCAELELTLENQAPQAAKAAEPAKERGWFPAGGSHTPFNFKEKP